MKRQDLIDNIEGSRLKKQYLEAFLLQSTFIEALLRKVVENDLFAAITYPILSQKFKSKAMDQDMLSKSRQVEYIEKRLQRQNLYETIEYLCEVDVISKDLRKKLHKYRDSRNEVLHNLVAKMSKEEFESELRELVDLGLDILTEEAMIEASSSVQTSEELRDIIRNPDPEAVLKYFKQKYPHDEVQDQTGAA